MIIKKYIYIKLVPTLGNCAVPSHTPPPDDDGIIMDDRVNFQLTMLVL